MTAVKSIQKFSFNRQTCNRLVSRVPNSINLNTTTSAKHHTTTLLPIIANMLKPKRPLELDGRTGEGGGQLVRIACALSTLTTQPIRITHVRGNREGVRGGGLKAQHLSAIQWLAAATDAETEGVEIQSKTFELRPRLPPTALVQRNIKIVADTPAASTLLIFQAIFPFLLFAGTADDEPIVLEIHGGTNVHWSPSYEYLDQVLLPALHHHFGIDAERRLVKRGWAQGGQSRGVVWFKFTPIRPGETLKPRSDLTSRAPDEQLGRLEVPQGEIPQLSRIDVSLVVPVDLQSSLQNALSSDLETLFPGTEVHFLTTENSGHESRIYILLVAHAIDQPPPSSGTTTTTTSSEGSIPPSNLPRYHRRWGRDFTGSGREFLYSSKTRKKMTLDQLSAGISRTLCKDLHTELSTGGAVDEFLQDQLVVFQAIAEGRTSFPRASEDEDVIDEVLPQIVRDISLADGVDGPESSVEGGGDVTSTMRKDKTHKPFGQGSTHTTTARWVASELVPEAKWFEKGGFCEGGAVRVMAPEARD